MMVSISSSFSSLNLKPFLCSPFNSCSFFLYIPILPFHICCFFFFFFTFRLLCSLCFGFLYSIPMTGFGRSHILVPEACPKPFFGTLKTPYHKPDQEEEEDIDEDDLQHKSMLQPCARSLSWGCSCPSHDTLASSQQKIFSSSSSWSSNTSIGSYGVPAFCSHAMSSTCSSSSSASASSSIWSSSKPSLSSISSSSSSPSSLPSESLPSSKMVWSALTAHACCNANDSVSASLDRHWDLANASSWPSKAASASRDCDLMVPSPYQQSYVPWEQQIIIRQQQQQQQQQRHHHFIRPSSSSESFWKEACAESIRISRGRPYVRSSSSSSSSSSSLTSTSHPSALLPDMKNSLCVGTSPIRVPLSDEISSFPRTNVLLSSSSSSSSSSPNDANLVFKMREFMPPLASSSSSSSPNDAALVFKMREFMSPPTLHRSLQSVGSGSQTRNCSNSAPSDGPAVVDESGSGIGICTGRKTLPFQMSAVKLRSCWMQTNVLQRSDLKCQLLLIVAVMLLLLFLPPMLPPLPPPPFCLILLPIIILLFLFYEAFASPQLTRIGGTTTSSQVHVI